MAVVLFSGCTTVEVTLPVLASKNSDCYHARNSFEDPPGHNLHVFCKTDTNASQRIYFDNGNYLPTICYQFGTIIDSDKSVMTVKYLEGRCDNGRSLNSSVESCEVIDENAIECKAEGWPSLVFNKLVITPGL